MSDVLNRRQDAAHWPRAVLVAKDETRRDIAESVSAIRRTDGDGFGVVVVFRDVTAQTRLEAELQKNQRLEALALLASGVAHDFNNILLGVLGNLGIAKERITNLPTTARLIGAERAAMRARELAHQLMTLAKGSQPPRSSARVESVVGEAAHFALSGSKSRCAIKLDDDVTTFDVAPDQIGRVIQNLVLNADQAMVGGGVVEIHVSSIAGEILPRPLPGQFVCVAVRDRGPGIPPDVLERIFEPYYTTKATGSGLGLAVTQSIVAQHGGWIEVESHVGEGTTFYVYLPTPSHGAPAGPSAAASPRRGTRRFRTLMLEDDETVAEIGVEMLESLGASVVLAQSGEEAIAAYERARTLAVEESRDPLAQPFDVLLFDMTVRGAMGGPACLTALRQLGCTGRAILSSGYAQGEKFLGYRDSGFDAALPKPYSLEELRVSLDAVLGAPIQATVLRPSRAPPPLL